MYIEFLKHGLQIRVSLVNNELKKNNLLLDTVYIPSRERINERKNMAIEEQRKWGHRQGVSDQEIERNYINYGIILQNIKDCLKDTTINVKEV